MDDGPDGEQIQEDETTTFRYEMDWVAHRGGNSFVKRGAEAPERVLRYDPQGRRAYLDVRLGPHLGGRTVWLRNSRMFINDGSWYSVSVFRRRIGVRAGRVLPANIVELSWGTKVSECPDFVVMYNVGISNWFDLLRLLSSKVGNDAQTVA